jgi:hypothetical protein
MARPKKAARAKAPAPGKRPPGVCVPWEEKEKEFPPMTGDQELVRRVWQDVDGLAYMYIWHCVLSF